jgi:ankyrin repeat protein
MYGIHHQCVMASRMNRAIIGAVYSDDTDLIERLFRDGYDINEVDHSGRTALHIAVKFKKVATIGKLCDCSSDANVIDHKNREGITALHIAVRMKDIQIVRLLLTRGASVMTSDMSLVTPLHDAVRLRSLRIIRTLLEHGASMHIRDLSGYTPLLRSAAAPPAVFIILLQHDSFQVVGRYKKTLAGETLLHLAYKEANPELLGLLLELAIWDVNAQDVHGDTLLHKVAGDGRSTLVRRLLRQYGAYSALRNSDSKTPLDLAIERVDPPPGGHGLGEVRHGLCEHRLRRVDDVNRDMMSEFSFIGMSDDLNRMIFRYL